MNELRNLIDSARAKGYQLDGLQGPIVAAVGVIESIFGIPFRFGNHFAVICSKNTKRL